MRALAARRPRLPASAGAAAIAIAAAIACVPAALVVAAWPVTATLGAVVAGLLVAAWKGPRWALLGAVALFGFEGSIKLMLELEPTPLPAGNRAAGTAALDLALFAAVLGV